MEGAGRGKSDGHTPGVLVLVAVTFVNCAHAGALRPCCRVESQAAFGKTAGCVNLIPSPVNDAQRGDSHRVAHGWPLNEILRYMLRPWLAPAAPEGAYESLSLPLCSALNCTGHLSVTA